MNISYRERNGKIQAIVSYKQQGRWKQKAKQGFKTKKEAKQWAESVSLTILEDRRDNITDSNMTVKQLCDLFFDHRKNDLRTNTINAYLVAIKSITDLFDMKVTDLKPFDIQSHYNKLREKTGSSYHSQIKYIKAIFNFAINDLRIIRTNPVNKLKSTSEDNRIKYITEDLYKKILNSKRSKTFKLIINLLYFTGMRYSEVMGITIHDLEGNMLSVNQQMDRKTKKLMQLKTKNSKRVIPIPHWLARDIKNIEIINIDGRIFENYHQIHSHLKKFNVSAHCFRHTYATNLVHQGINLKVAADLLGDTFDVFCKTYVESSEDLAKEEFKKIQSNF